MRKPIARVPVHAVPYIKKRILQGEKQQDIAADYGLNQGRISEIKSGAKFAEVPAAP